MSARDPGHWSILRAQLLVLLLGAAATTRSEAVAVEIMDRLVEARLHRTVPLPDVMIAAVAVVERLTVLHDDRDFARIHGSTTRRSMSA